VLRTAQAIRELVGKRDRQDVVVQPFLGGFDPGSKPIAVPQQEGTNLVADAGP
jgi:hypothetical protein